MRNQYGIKVWPDGNCTIYLNRRDRAVPKPEPGPEPGHGPGSAREPGPGPGPAREPGARRKYHNRDMVRKIFCLTALLRNEPACFFTVTSAGRPGRLTGKEIDRLFTYLRNVHGLKSYYWVKEKTKQGWEHLHCVAVFKPGYRMSYWIAKKNAVRLSDWWAGVLGQKSYQNSIRFGWYDAKGIRHFYLSKGFGGGYCAKYLTKNKERVTGRRLGISENIQEYAKPYSDRLVWHEEFRTGPFIDKRRFIDRAEGTEQNASYGTWYIPGLNFYGAEVVLEKFLFSKKITEDGFYFYIGRTKKRLKKPIPAHRIFTEIT